MFTNEKRDKGLLIRRNYEKKIITNLINVSFRYSTRRLRWKSKRQTSSSAEPTSVSSVTPSSDSAGSSDSTPSNVAVTGVTLDKATASIVKGETLTLVATVAPATATNKEVTWTSSDEDVVTVSKAGVVTAQDVGTATVKVKTKDGNHEASCVVTVIKNINSITISNKSAFEGFVVDDSESINLTVDPEDNVSALLAAGAVHVTSSDTSVATISGLTVNAIKAGTSKITVELFGKTDNFDLTVGEAIPGVKYSVADALAKAFEEAKWNGKAGSGSAITTTCFELQGKVIAINESAETSFDVILDDGTQAVYLQFTKGKDEAVPVEVGDYAKVTCKFTNYYGLLEGVSRKAENLKTSPKIPLKDIEKVDAPETPITPYLNEAETMTAEQYDAYYTLCKTNGTKDDANATYTFLKRVKIGVTYNSTDYENFKYAISNKYGLEIYNSDALDKPFEGQKSTVEVFLLGANTGKSKSNSILVEQTPLAVENLAIDQEAQTIVHGNTLQLSYTTTPAGSYSRTVAWKSSDETVATVDQTGLVTGIYVGTGTKTATIEVEINSIKKSVEISVFGEDVAAQTASLPATASVYVNESVKLTATTNPAMVSDTPIWASDNEAVATVDSKGNVKGISEGEANITVRYNANAAATCKVTVSWEKGIRQTDPLSVDEALAMVASSANGYKTTKEYFIKGFVAQIDEDSLSKSYNNATFWLASTEKAKGFEGYRMKPVEACKNYDDFKVGAEVLIGCKIYKYNATTVENDGGNIYSIAFAEHPATGITMKATETVNVGSKVKLATSMTPFYATSAITWETSDATIATVNKGEVTGVKAGQATITAKVSETVKAECVVTVNEAEAVDVKWTSAEFFGYDGSADVGYGSVAEKTLNGITLGFTDMAAYKNQGGDIQFKKTSGYLEFKTATTKRIAKLILEKSGSKAYTCKTYAASTVAGLASASAATGNNEVYTFDAAADIHAIKIGGGTGASYLKSISIVYAD